MAKHAQGCYFGHDVAHRLSPLRLLLSRWRLLLSDRPLAKNAQDSCYCGHAERDMRCHDGSPPSAQSIRLERRGERRSYEPALLRSDRLGQARFAQHASFSSTAAANETLGLDVCLATKASLGETDAPRPRPYHPLRLMPLASTRGCCWPAGWLEPCVQSAIRAK